MGVGFSLGANLGHVDIHTALALLPATAWTPAYQARKLRAGQTGPQVELRDGAWVAKLSGFLDLSAWPPGTRLILRKERPHPVRSCASPTTTGCGSPVSSPTPASAGLAANCPTWNYASAHTPASRTASAAGKTPALPTSHSTTWRRTGSGWPSPHRPPIRSGASAPRESRGTLGVVLEATYGWYWAADALADLGANVHLAHPLGVKAFSYRRVKNERDAADLADLLRMRFSQQDQAPSQPSHSAQA